MSFNSTMVRLKYKSDGNVLKDLMFQFHYGTIKMYVPILSKIVISVSIPLWYD